MMNYEIVTLFYIRVHISKVFECLPLIKLMTVPIGIFLIDLQTVHNNESYV